MQQCQSSWVLYVCQIMEGKEFSKPLGFFYFVLRQRHGQLNFKWSIWKRRACDQCPNGGNTNVLSLWCKSAETVSDSPSFRPAALRSSRKTASSMCVSVSVRAWIWKKLAHLVKISDFYGENMLWKRSKAEHVHVHMRTRASPSGTNLHHWMLHIFTEHISCEKLP